MVSALTSTGIALAVSIATTLLTAVAGSTIDSWNAIFQVDDFRWDYNVRLNSNSGELIYTTTRDKDYWKVYSETTGKQSYKYRGSAYDQGFLLSNNELIKAAIDSYVGG